MKFKDIVFIERQDMTSVCEKDEILDSPEIAYLHFMKSEDDVLYVLDKGKMFGVISIGDMERFYGEETSELRINQNYTSADTVDYHKAYEFFTRVRTINEIPIVTGKKQLLGIIRYNKNRGLKIQQRESLSAARKGRGNWYRKEIHRFIKKTKAKVFLYTISEKTIDSRMHQSEAEILYKRIQERDSGKRWMGLSEDEWKRYWRSQYDDGIADRMKEEMNSCQMVMSNGVVTFSDMEGEFYSFKHGYRVTPGNPPDADRRIFMYGPCVVAGAYCKDSQTIAAYIQNKLTDHNYANWKVLNKGSFGMECCYDKMFVEELSEDDIVIVIWYLEKNLPENSINKCIVKKDLSKVFLRLPSLTDNILDRIWHCNYAVNQRLAEEIFMDLYTAGTLNSPKQCGMPVKIQDYYIGWDIHEYFMDYMKQHNLYRKMNTEKIGAVVMNCNPFTKGHRYLIDKALKMVDWLYIFVVEEDKSYFSFNERFEMVKLGVKDLSNVRVIPSGRYILSKDTFAQYFEKAQISEVESMDYDIYIFGEVVASKLGIQYRFVGTEPFDKVTQKYNETMKRILPEFRIKVIEIPRKEAELYDGKKLISATTVREAVKKNDMDTISVLCPEDVAKYIANNYLKAQED